MYPIKVFVKSLKKEGMLISVQFVPTETTALQGQQIVRGMQMMAVGVVILDGEFAIGPLTDMQHVGSTFDPVNEGVVDLDKVVPLKETSEDTKYETTD